MTTAQHVRHGDVLLVRIDEIPIDARPVEHAGSYVLAEGETTGHKHLLTVEKPEQLQVAQAPGNVLYLSLEVPAPLRHEEHKEVMVPSGKWKMIFEQEHDYFEEHSRTVID